MRRGTKLSSMKIASLTDKEVRNNKLFENQIYWTVKDLMKFTGLSRQTIYNKVSKQELPVRKIWGKLYFIPEEITNMIEEGEMK